MLIETYDYINRMFFISSRNRNGIIITNAALWSVMAARAARIRRNKEEQGTVRCHNSFATVAGKYQGAALHHSVFC